MSLDPPSKSGAPADAPASSATVPMQPFLHHRHLCGARPSADDSASAPRLPFRADSDQDFLALATQVAFFNSAEHVAIGDRLQLTMPGTYPSGETVDAATFYMDQPNGLSLRFAQILALAGDFFGDVTYTARGRTGIVDVTVNEICDDPNPPTVFDSSFRSLTKSATAGRHPRPIKDVVRDIFHIMQREVDAAKSAAFNGDQPSAAYAQLTDLDSQYNVATGGTADVVFGLRGTYMELALRNRDHFGADALKAYAVGHGEALKQALLARNAGSKDESQKMMAVAYSMEGFACHFLSDIFAAGHARTPRRQLDGSTGSACAKFMHDEDNHFGLLVSNRAGLRWKAFGDARYYDSVNWQNRVVAHFAVQRSVDEVWTAFRKNDVPESAKDFAALRFVPRLGQLAQHEDRHNGAALFYYDGADGYARNSLTDLTDYSWTTNWAFATTAAELKQHSGSWARYTGPSNTLHPPTVAIGPISTWTEDTPFGRNWQSGNHVRYAISFFDTLTGNESELGPWSAWTPITTRCCPQLRGLPTYENPPSGIPAARLARRVLRQFRLATGSNTLVQFVDYVRDNVATTFTDSVP